MGFGRLINNRVKVIPELGKVLFRPLVGSLKQRDVNNIVTRDNIVEGNLFGLICNFERCIHSFPSKHLSATFDLTEHATVDMYRAFNNRL